MLVLRLARTGRKKYATFRLVAADSRRAAQGKYLSQLGHYNPHTKDFVFEKAEVDEYIKKGAQPSGSVVKLLLREKVSLPDWAKANLKVKKKAPKKKEQKTETPAAAKSTEAEAKAEDKKKTESQPAEEAKDSKSDEVVETPKSEEESQKEEKKDQKGSENPAENKSDSGS